MSPQCSSVFPGLSRAVPRSSICGPLNVAHTQATVWPSGQTKALHLSVPRVGPSGNCVAHHHSRMMACEVMFVSSSKGWWKKVVLPHSALPLNLILRCLGKTKGMLFTQCACRAKFDMWATQVALMTMGGLLIFLSVTP